jgi:hypothetical protein
MGAVQPGHDPYVPVSGKPIARSQRVCEDTSNERFPSSAGVNQMIQLQSHRKTVPVASLLGIAVIGTAGMLLAQKIDPNAEEEPSWSVQPINPDLTTRAIFEDQGVNSVGFEYRVPPDNKVRLRMIATDADGHRIKELSGTIEEAPLEKGVAHEGRFRLTRMDPAALTEGYRGKVHWVKRINRSSGQEWLDDRYTTSGPYSSWPLGTTVSNPEQGREYLLWEIKAHPKDLRRILPDSPTTFSFQIWFRYEPMQDGDIYGSTGFGDGEVPQPDE